MKKIWRAPPKAGLEKLEIVRNGRSAVPEGRSWQVKISAVAHKISSNFFERTPP